MKLHLLLPLRFALTLGPLAVASAATPGTQLWVFTATERPAAGVYFGHSPAIAPDGTLFFGCGLRMYAIDGATGTLRWEAPTREVVSAPAALGTDLTLYVRAGRAVHALDAVHGVQRWEFHPLFYGGDADRTTPAVAADGTVYFGGGIDKQIYALDGATGAKRWQFGTEGRVSSSPAIGVDGTVYVCSEDGKIYALDGATGARRWAYFVHEPVQSSPAIGADGTVYTGYSSVIALNGVTGDKRWEHRLAPSRTIYSDCVTIGADGTLYLSDGYVTFLALDGSTGAERWSANDWEFDPAPVIAADGTVYVSTGNGLLALRGETGTQRWVISSGFDYYSDGPPVVGPDGTVYVGFGPRLYALAGSAGLAQSPWPKFRGDARNSGNPYLTGAGIPTFALQPRDQHVPVGETASLMPMVRGATPMAFQWWTNGAPVPGGTNLNLALPAMTLDQSGLCFLIVRNAFGTVTSTVAHVVVGYPLNVTVRGQGTVQANPTLAAYEPGQIVGLTAVPKSGLSFVRWHGDATGSANPLSLTMDAPRSVEAEFSPAPGDKLWEFATGGPVGSSPALGSDGTVFFGSDDKKVYALDGATGAKRWEFLTGGPVRTAPAITPDGTVIAAGEDGTHYALDGATGTQRWKLVTGSPVQTSPAIGPDGTVYNWHGGLAALDGATGLSRWPNEFSPWRRYEDPLYRSGWYTAAMGPDGLVYASGWWIIRALGRPVPTGGEAEVWALDGATGTLRWRKPGDAEPVPGTIGPQATVYAWPQVLDAASGNLLGSFSDPYAGHMGGLPAEGTDGLLYIGGSVGKIHAFQATTRAKVWEFVTGGPVYSSPAVAADGTVVVGSDDGNLYAIDGTSGAQRWMFATGRKVRSSPAIGPDGTIYVGSDDTKLYALRGSAPLADSPWPKYRHDNRNTGSAVAAAPGIPRIASQPQDVRLPIGTSFILGVVAAGSLPLGYQWYRDDLPIPGATNVLWRVAQADLMHAGAHVVVVANPAGSVTSAVARVVVGYTLSVTNLGVGTIRTNPVLAVYDPGQRVELTATPGPDRQFLGWSGDASGPANPLTVVMDATKRIAARFSVGPGDPLWESAVGGGPVTFPAIAQDGTVYVGTQDQRVFALNGVSGENRWVSTAVASIPTALALAPDETVCVLCKQARRIYALDGATGAMRWEFAAEADLRSVLAIGADGSVMAALDRTVFALDGTTGARRWEFVANYSVDDNSLAVGLDGTAYVGSGLKLHALDAASGLPRWVRDFPPNSFGPYECSIGQDGTVYVSSADLIYALDGGSGYSRWVWTGSARKSLTSAPTLGVDGSLFVAWLLYPGGVPPVSRFSVLDAATGTAVASFKQARQAAVGSNGTLYFDAGQAVDGLTGVMRWRTSVVGAPALGRAPILYQVRDGRLLAFQASSGLARSAWPNIRGDASNARLQGLPGEGPPALALQPKDQSVSVGGTAFLTAAAKGTPPLSYRWWHNGLPLPGTDSGWLILTNASAALSGAYSVVVSNALGQTTSVVARLYVGVPLIHRVVVSTMAGSGVAGHRDGFVWQALFNAPNGACVDAARNILVADAGNHRIRRIAPDGAVSTFAGAGLAGIRDGAADQARFSSPLGVCTDAQGNVFVADSANHRIRRIDLDGQVTTLAGTGVAGYRDGPAASAEFNSPNDLVVDQAGNLFVTESANHTVRFIAPGGSVSTWVGNGASGSADGFRTDARLNQPGGLALDTAGNLYITEWGGHRVRRVTSEGAVSTLAGSIAAGYLDGPGAQARFLNPKGIVADAQGFVYVADSGNHVLRRIDPSGTVETLAGAVQSGYADGFGAAARFFNPGGLGIDRYGSLYVADTANHRVRRVAWGAPVTITADPQGTNVVAGTPVTLTVGATGGAPLGYRWRKDGAFVDAAFESSLVFTNARLSDAGSFDALVWNHVSIATSHVAVVTVSEYIPIPEPGQILVRVAEGGRIELRWVEGGLEEAAEVIGPWTPVPDAASPWIVIPSDAHRYYRLVPSRPGPEAPALPASPDFNRSGSRWPAPRSSGSEEY